MGDADPEVIRKIDPTFFNRLSDSKKELGEALSQKGAFRSVEKDLSNKGFLENLKANPESAKVRLRRMIRKMKSDYLTIDSLDPEIAAQYKIKMDVKIDELNDLIEKADLNINQKRLDNLFLDVQKINPDEKANKLAYFIDEPTHFLSFARDKFDELNKLKKVEINDPVVAAKITKELKKWNRLSQE